MKMMEHIPKDNDTDIASAYNDSPNMRPLVSLEPHRRIYSKYIYGSSTLSTYAMMLQMKMANNACDMLYYAIAY